MSLVCLLLGACAMFSASSDVMTAANREWYALVSHLPFQDKMLPGAVAAKQKNNWSHADIILAIGDVLS